MSRRILNFLIKLYGPDFNDETLHEVLKNSVIKKLAIIGDCILDLVLVEAEYTKKASNPETMNKLREKLGKKTKNQEILVKDKDVTQYLLSHDYPKGNPQGKIGLERSDAYMEAIIGAIYLTHGLHVSRKYVEEIYDLEKR